MILDNGLAVVVPESTYNDSRHMSYNTAGFVMSCEYTNYTQMSLYLKTQTNMPFVLEPNGQIINASDSRPHLEVKMTYKLQNNASISETMQLLSALVNNNEHLSADAAQLHQRLEDLYKRDGSRSNKMNFAFSVFKTIQEDEIKRTKSVYIRECDLVIAKDRTAIRLPHPNSPEGLQQTEFNSSKIYYGQAGIFVKVVDNECLAKQRYYYSGKHLITVPSSSDNLKESGVYYTVSTMDTDGMITPETMFISFKDAEEILGLYRFQEDAMSHGNPEILLKAEDSRHKAEERRLANQVQTQKHAHDLESMKFERELSEIKQTLEFQKAENAALKESLEIRKNYRDEGLEIKKQRLESTKQESEVQKQHYEGKKRKREDYFEDRDRRRKDYYEDRSYTRKDTSELIKFVPAVLLGIAGTFAFMQSRKA